MGNLKTTQVRSALGGLIRDEMKKAAGEDGRLSAQEQAKLSRSFLRKASQAVREEKGKDPTVTQAVDRAMAESRKAWARFNTEDPAHLDAAEMATLSRHDPSLGKLTRMAAEIAGKSAQDPRIPQVRLDTPDPGITLAQNGDLFTLKAKARVPDGTQFTLTVDGQAFPMTRFPGGFLVNNLVDNAPAGCGVQQVKNSATRGALTAVLQIRKDPPGWLTEAQALATARTGLLEYVKTTRSKDPDWKGVFGEDWQALVQRGLLDQVAHFGTGDGASVVRGLDRFTFVGRGPLDLYTEVDVAKDDGRILRAYVEID